jgi:hypothetical protein
MLERIQDRIASVRVQAVVALQRLQDPSNKECPVIKVIFLFKLKSTFMYFFINVFQNQILNRQWFFIWSGIPTQKSGKLCSSHWVAVILPSLMY